MKKIPNLGTAILLPAGLIGVQPAIAIEITVYEVLGPKPNQSVDPECKLTFASNRAVESVFEKSGGHRTTDGYAQYNAFIKRDITTVGQTCVAYVSLQVFFNDWYYLDPPHLRRQYVDKGHIRDTEEVCNKGTLVKGSADDLQFSIDERLRSFAKQCLHEIWGTPPIRGIKDHGEDSSPPQDNRQAPYIRPL